MSVSEARLFEFATYIKENVEVLDAIREEVDRDLFMRFRMGSEQDRKEVADLANAESLLIGKINNILNRNNPDNENLNT